MNQALKCPECSAPLDPPVDGARSVQCPYCHTTVILNDASSGACSADLGIGMDVAIGKAVQIAQMEQYIRSGNTIEAIRIYRLCYGADLVTAQAAVESLRAGRRVVAGTPAASTIVSSSFKAGCVMAIIGTSLAALIVIGLLVRVVNTAVPNHPTFVPPVLNPQPAPPALPAPSPPPSFASQVLEFGSDGIGAGQFKDARSIALDGAGHIYVGEYSGGRVQVFDGDGKFLKTWSVDARNCLSNLAVNREGTVLAIVAGKILSFEGMTGRAFGEAATTNGDTQEIYRDACYALTGDIFAIDNDSNVVILDSTGQIKRTIKVKQNTGDDEVSFDKIAVNGNGQIYAIDHKQGVFQFAPDGRYLNRFGMGDDSDPTDRRPDTLHIGLNLAIDGQGRIYVGDVGPAIKVFDRSGRFLDSIGGNDVCFGLTINDQNEVFGCFRNQHVVRKFVLAKK